MKTFQKGAENSCRDVFSAVSAGIVLPDGVSLTQLVRWQVSCFIMLLRVCLDARGQVALWEVSQQNNLHGNCDSDNNGIFSEEKSVLEGKKFLLSSTGNTKEKVSMYLSWQ